MKSYRPGLALITRHKGDGPTDGLRNQGEIESTFVYFWTRKSSFRQFYTAILTAIQVKVLVSSFKLISYPDLTRACLTGEDLGTRLRLSRIERKNTS